MSDYSEAESAAGIATSTTAGENSELLRIIQGALGGSQGGLHDAIDAKGARMFTIQGSNSISTSTVNGSAGGQRQQVNDGALGNILESWECPIMALAVAILLLED